MKTTCLLAVLAAAWLIFVPSHATGAEFMFRANVEGQLIEGKPLMWNSQQMLLLGRDGKLHDFNPKLATDAEKTSPSFVPYSAAEMKSLLQHEFDNRFEVSTTRHYLVVHPRGERDEWSDRFEDLYNRFGHYFRVRGFGLQEPPYPLVAIVFRDQAEYFRSAAASGTPMHPNTMGHYDPLSNRVFLFDVTAGKKNKKDWSENAETIIHEATHQTAFNAGVHRRFAAEPRWLVEGLATMFEAPGVWSARYDHTQADRVNRGRLTGFRKYVKHRQPGSLSMLVSTDDAFRSDPDGAYAEAWALSFYLCETQPRLYAAYLTKTAERPIFSEYTTGERMADFQAVFGSDLKMLDAKFLRYMEEVK